jgi:hypothetical protein
VLDISGQYKLAAADRADLVISRSRPELEPVRVSQSLRKRFGRSLKMRSVSAGGCNGCELEINALTNVNFDIGRYGIESSLAPSRRCPGAIGPVTQLAQALSLCWQGMPDPKFVIAVLWSAVRSSADALGASSSAFLACAVRAWLSATPAHFRGGIVCWGSTASSPPADWRRGKIVARAGFRKCRPRARRRIRYGRTGIGDE